MEIPPFKIKEITQKYNIKADKKLGQNFLVDPNALQNIINAAEITSDMSILEIGAGLGFLTRYLAGSAAHVVAVEIDQRLTPGLEKVLDSIGNVTLIYGDILKLNPDEIMKKDHYLVVANIPYYITSAIIRHLLEAKIKPQRIILTIQQEVAERICSQPGKMSILALSVQVYGKVRIVNLIPSGAFFPAPKVDSAILRIDIYDEPVINPLYLDIFFRLINAGFGQKRKILRNALSHGLVLDQKVVEHWLHSLEIDSRRRAETLSMKEWQILSENFTSLF